MGAAVPFAFQDNAEVARRFPDLHPAFDSNQALTEANRCLNCFDAPCTAACPTHIDVPRFIQKIATQNLMGSALTILDANILGASCSRVCPVEVLCEGACVLLRYNQQPIAIGRLQRRAMDHFWERGAPLPKKSDRKRSQKIVCIGAGPASLACAAELAQQGFSVTVLEQRALPGGLNTYGVAEYKLRAPDSLREVAMIADLGVEFRFGVSIEDEHDLATLERDYDAIFLGIGLGATHELRIPGADHNVNVAVNVSMRWSSSQDTRPPAISWSGITSSLLVRATLLLTRPLRRGEWEPLESLSSTAGPKVTSRLSVLSMSTPNMKASCSSGWLSRWRFTPARWNVRNRIPPFQLPCDMLILAIGQTPLSLLERCRGPKYYSGGDCVNGGREVVDAVADGKRAALAIAKSFEASHA